jgi:hypothetical protein
VRDRGVTITQAAEDLGLHQKLLRKWVKETRPPRCLNVSTNGNLGANAVVAPLVLNDLNGGQGWN